MVTATPTRESSSRIALLLLLVTVVAAAAMGWQALKTGDFVALWLTPDQRARLAFDNKEFDRAFDTFESASWKGVAAYNNGDYPEAAAVFGLVASAEGFYNRGNAFMKTGEYGKAIVAYQQAVHEAPDWPQAKDNLELANYTLEYIERLREDSDTGDESELGADDYVYDNTRERGLEIEITEQSTIELESAEKWMRGVDTDTRDFLRMRFLLEASRSEAAP